MFVSRICFAAAVAAGGASALADTVTAFYTSTFDQDVNHSRGGNTNDQRTVKFNWSRTDGGPDGGGSGVDVTVPAAFPTYCVDLDQNVSANTNYTFEVQSFAQAGFGATQELYLERLWGTYFSSVTDSTVSAAFQMAVWELTFDTGGDLANGNYRGNSAPSVVAAAQIMLSDVTSGSFSGLTQDLVVLHSDSVQDQITPPIPAPGAIALAGLSAAVAYRRRRD